MKHIARLVHTDGITSLTFDKDELITSAAEVPAIGECVNLPRADGAALVALVNHIHRTRPVVRVEVNHKRLSQRAAGVALCGDKDGPFLRIPVLVKK
jgi:hypothetical protein